MWAASLIPWRIAVAVGIDTVQGEREPDRQTAGPPGELVTEIARVVRLVVGAQHVDVRAVLRVHQASERGLSVHERTRAGRCEQPLVWIDDERVGALEAGEPSMQLRQQDRGQSVGAVDVQPGVDLTGHVGAAVEIVDHAGIGRATGGHDDADIAPITDRGTQRLAGQAAIRPGRHYQRLEPEDVQRVVDRGVRCVGDCDEPSIPGAVAADGQCRQVADRTATHETAGGAERASRRRCTAARSPGSRRPRHRHLPATTRPRSWPQTRSHPSTPWPPTARVG